MFYYNYCDNFTSSDLLEKHLLIHMSLLGIQTTICLTILQKFDFPLKNELACCEVKNRIHLPPFKIQYTTSQRIQKHKGVQHSQEEGRQSALNAFSLIGSCYLNEVKGIFLKECG